MNNTYQLSKVKKSLKTVKDPIIRERLIIVKSYYQNQSLRIAAEQCGCCHMKVKTWKDRYEKEGLKGLKSKPKSGRPPELDQDQTAKIKQVVTRKASKEGWQTKQIREYIKEQSGVLYSERHTIRIAQNWGLARVKPRAQYAYTDKKANETFLKGKSPNISQKTS